MNQAHIHKWPKISIITPSYNQGVFLEATINSVLRQNYPNLEYIIIDGGSTDNSVDIIRKYASKITFWVSEKDNGQAHAINKGLKQCTGEIIGWLNSDDLLLDGVLFEIADFFNDKLDQEVFLSGSCRYEDTEGQVIWAPKVTNGTIKKSNLRVGNLLRCWKNNLVQPSTFWTRKVFERLGYLNAERHFALDLDYWLRAVDNNLPIYLYDKVLSVFVYHDESKSKSQQKVLNKDLKCLAKKYFSGRNYFAYLLEFYIYRYSYFYLKLANSIVQKHRFKSLRYLVKGFIYFPLSIFLKPYIYFFVIINLILGKRKYEYLKKHVL